MNTLLIYGIFLLGHLCVYFYFKNSLSILNFNNDPDAVKDIQIEKSLSEQKKNPKSLNLSDNMEDNNHVLLNKSLKHLEFIAEFEMYLEQKTLNNFSVEFLKEFEQIKIEAQLTTLKTTNQLNTTAKIAA